MSLDFEKRVLSHSETKRSQRFLMMVLAHHADKDGVCWPGVATLADEMNAAPRNINNLLAKIRETGEVIILEGGGRSHSNIYLITLGQTQEDIDKILSTHHRINPVKKDRVYNEGNSGVNPDVLSKKTDEKDGVYEGVNPDVLSRNPDVFCINPDQNIRGTNRTENELNTTTATDPRGANFNVDLADCLSLYCNNISPELSPVQVDDFEDIYNGLSPPINETKYEWFQYAVLEALNNRANKLSYVKAILEKVNRARSLAQHKEKRNGSTNVGTGKQKTDSPSAKTGNRQWPSPSYRPAAGDTTATGRDEATNARLRSVFGR